MKKMIVSMLMALPFLALAQKGYVIKGAIKGLKEPATVYMEYNRGAFKDSAVVKKGRFRFKGSLAEPTQVFLTLRSSTVSRKQRPDMYVFWLENADISLTATGSLKSAVVKGSSVEKESRELEAAVNPHTKTIIRMMDEADTKPSQERRQQLGDSITMLVKQIKDIRTRFVETHPNSYVGLYTFYTAVLDKNFDPDVAEPMFHKFPAALQSSGLGKQVVAKLEAGRRRQAGAAATDFTQNDLNGKPFTLSSLRGKYVLVDFWASWCAPCRKENPHLIKAYKELKDKNFEVVGVSLDQAKAPWEDAVEKDGLPWIHVSDLKGWQNEVAVKYGINSVPQNLLIDPQGIIIATNLRGEGLTEKLAAHIK